MKPNPNPRMVDIHRSQSIPALRRARQAREDGTPEEGDGVVEMEMVEAAKGGGKAEEARTREPGRRGLCDRGRVGKVEIPEGKDGRRG